MKNIINIFLADLKNIGRNAMVFIVIIGISIIPSLYAWFNIAANWDPYSSTNGIKVAVSNCDESIELFGKKFNIGDMVVDNLQKNKQIGWQFIDKKDAVEGTYSGKYYAAIVIPENFTYCISSVLTGNIQQPNIIYYSNEKKNAVAPKITDKGADSIQQQINETFISQVTTITENVLETVVGNIQDGSDNIIDELKTVLKKSSDNLSDTNTAISTFGDTVDSISGLIDTVGDFVPNTDKIISESKTALTDLKKLSKASAASVESVANSVNSSLSSVNDLSDIVNLQIDEAYNLVDKDADSAIEKLKTSKEYLDKIYGINADVADELQRINSSLPIELEGIKQIISKINNTNTKIQSLSNKLTETINFITDNKTISKDLKSQIKSLQDKVKTDISSTKSTYTTNIKQKLSNVGDSFDTLIDDTQTLLSGVKSTSPDITNTLKTLKSSLKSADKALSGTTTIITNAQNKIKQTQDKLEEVKNSKDLKQVISILSNDSQKLSEFMASPVNIKTQKIYPIENYGSAMAPFYSTLAIWVGGIVLVAILKVKVKKNNRLTKVKPYQEYLGRYILFFLLAEIQATIICLGDIFFLDIQCVHPIPFFVAGLVSAFVYSLIIYTLTVSFGDIGKAMAVILLVIQIGGSNGTFPIECTPQFFQNVCPFLPFTYTINAMRECVAGMYGTNFIMDLLYLLAFVPVALLLGLVLRKPLINVQRFFDKRIEDSDIM